jgi:hypothetical protein
MRVSGKDVLESLDSSSSAADQGSENGAKIEKVGILPSDLTSAWYWNDRQVGFQQALNAQAGVTSAQGVSSISPQNTLPGAPSNTVRLPTSPAPMMFQ